VSFRMRLAAWFGLSLIALLALLMITTHHHLDEELRADRWDRSHPKYSGWVIHGSFTDVEVQDILGELLHVWLWVGIPAVGVALSVGAMLASRSIRPVRAINRQLARLEPGSLGDGIALVESDPELADLVAHVNALLERAGAAYSEMASFSSKVAHELRTPLTLLRMKIEQSAHDLAPDLGEELQEELSRLSRFVERSLTAASAECGRLEISPEPINLSGQLEDLRDGYAILASQRNLDLDWRVPTGIISIADADLVRQVLHNLLGNAVRYASSKIRVRAYSRSGAVVTVSNDFDPRAIATPGVGLGLRLVRGICLATRMRFAQRKGVRSFSCRLHIRPIANS